MLDDGDTTRIGFERIVGQIVSNCSSAVLTVRGLSGNIVGLHQARAEYFALVGDYDQGIEQLDLAKRRASNFQIASRIDARQKQLIEEKRMVEEMLR